MEAARSGDPARVAALLDQGADARAAEPDGTTALHWAARVAAAEVVEHLLAAGADPERANRYGITPLALAAESGEPAIVGALLAAGADPNTATPAGETVLMVAARTGRVPVLDRLLAAGATVDATESWRDQTALMWAAAENNADAVRRLLAAGAGVEARSGAGLTPLLFAVREGHIDAVRALLNGGADVNAGVNNTTASTGSYTPAATGHTTPLALAIVNAHYELAATLLEAGADSNAYDARGTLLHALAWIRRPGSGRPPAPTGNLDSLYLARRLLAQGANPNVRIAWREIPFEVDLGIVKPPPNISVGRNFISFVGATPFYLAAKHADLELMKLLVDYGADPLTPTGQGVDSADGGGRPGVLGRRESGSAQRHPRARAARGTEDDPRPRQRPACGCRLRRHGDRRRRGGPAAAPPAEPAGAGRAARPGRHALGRLHGAARRRDDGLEPDRPVPDRAGC
ncbi:Ankyrin-3 [Geodia barretti]|uniref:Ankyrin-3 n=1 Tax=Geodia barretti TaxID=519541 RepID=A0AA35TYI5_GEOBA|nr:Ankyrin-3 [Geodia barretti]